MAITNGYTSLKVYKERFYDEGQGDTKDDTAIEDIVTAVSREIDNICGQRFHTTAADDYDLMPYNATLDSEPYTWIETTPNGDYSFPVGIRKGVEISGKFGWSSAPSPVVEACLLGAHRMMKRLQTPLGVSASAAMGELSVQVPKLRADPDLMGLLSPYIVGF
jgi:hypothetical protein